MIPTMLPAGQDYRSRDECVAAFERGRKFIFQDLTSTAHGTKASIHDLRRAGYGRIKLRYAKGQHVVRYDLENRCVVASQNPAQIAEVDENDLTPVWLTLGGIGLAAYLWKTFGAKAPPRQRAAREGHDQLPPPEDAAGVRTEGSPVGALEAFM